MGPSLPRVGEFPIDLKALRNVPVADTEHLQRTEDCCNSEEGNVHHHALFDCALVRRYLDVAIGL
jgi:hypothetical protein